MTETPTVYGRFMDGLSQLDLTKDDLEGAFLIRKNVGKGLEPYYSYVDYDQWFDNLECPPRTYQCVCEVDIMQNFHVYCPNIDRVLVIGSTCKTKFEGLNRICVSCFEPTNVHKPMCNKCDPPVDTRRRCTHCNALNRCRGALCKACKDQYI
jgi:hypothetical protein